MRSWQLKQKAAVPLSETWGEAKSLLNVLDKATNQSETRLRLRAVLRRMIDTIMMVVVGRKAYRLARVQIWFQGCQKERHYLIVYRKKVSNGKRIQSARYYVNSGTFGAMMHPEVLQDLRDPVAALSAKLTLQNHARRLVAWGYSSRALTSTYSRVVVTSRPGSR